MFPVPPTNPGIYPGSGQAVLLRADQQQYLFQQQLIAAGNASIAVQLERIKSSYFYPFGVSFQVYFTNINGVAANPGAFELDVQTSDIDADIQYSTISPLTGGLNASYSGRVELPSFWARFARVNLKTLTNAVYTTVLVTR